MTEERFHIEQRSRQLQSFIEVNQPWLVTFIPWLDYPARAAVDASKAELRQLGFV